MSTNKTENCQLHAWELGDDFILSEINENFAKLDELLGSVDRRIKITSGSYIGNGVDGRTFTTDFPPFAVFITCRSNEYNYYHALLLPGVEDAYGTITDTGFSVSGLLNYKKFNSGSIVGEKMNPYRYIALFWEE